VNSARFAAHERIVQFHNLYVELTSAVAEQNHALANERLGQMADIAGQYSGTSIRWGRA
jgi:hypothetical protein